MRFRYSVTKYLTKNMKLEINEEKTRVFDLTHERMKYLGYDFYVEKTHVKGLAGKFMVTNVLPKEKEDAIVERCRELLVCMKNAPTLENLHNWNVYVVGIHNYYRGMNKFCTSFHKIGWRISRLFYHTMEARAKRIEEQSYKDNYLEGRYRAWGKVGYYCFDRCPVIDIRWASWDRELIHATKCRVSRKNPYAYGEKKHKPGVSMDDISYLVNTSKHIKNSRLALFRVSKYSSVKGVSYLSGNYVPVWNYHCHHIIPKEKNGTDDFDNLCVLSSEEHRILHGNEPEQLIKLYPKKYKRIMKLINSL